MANKEVHQPGSLQKIEEIREKVQRHFAVQAVLEEINPDTTSLAEIAQLIEEKLVPKPKSEAPE